MVHKTLSPGRVLVFHFHLIMEKCDLQIQQRSDINKAAKRHTAYIYHFLWPNSFILISSGRCGDSHHWLKAEAQIWARFLKMFAAKGGGVFISLWKRAASPLSLGSVSLLSRQRRWQRSQKKFCCDLLPHQSDSSCLQWVGTVCNDSNDWYHNTEI